MNLNCLFESLFYFLLNNFDEVLARLIKAKNLPILEFG